MKRFITYKNFLKNPTQGVNFYKKNGYLIVKKVLNKSDYKFLLETISFNTNKFLKSKNNKKFVDYNHTSSVLNKNLLNLRKINKYKFADLYDSLQHTPSII